MQLYRDHRPTAFDWKGAFGLPGDHFVPAVIQTRDSGPLELSNFAAFGKALNAAGIEYETHRFGHWGPGWYEIYLVTPTDAARELIEELEGALADYPVLDDDDFSAREYEEARQTWCNCYLRERIDLIREYGDGNIWAARRDELPEDPSGMIMERLTRN